jgi:hypothetical protein
MADILIPANTSQTTRISMSGTDTLTVETNAALSVSANAQAVRFNGPTTNGQITNSGTIENTASGGRAIRFETSVGATLTATVTNNAAGLIESQDDAIQIQAGTVTGGTLTVGNTGIIRSTVGQALDFVGGTGALAVNITNGGSLLALANDAIRIGSVGTIINTAEINGGVAAGYTVNADGVSFEDNSSGSVTNSSGGDIQGDRHGVNAGLGTVITVTNNAGSTITGNNGSGVGSDGNAAVTNRGVITGAFSNLAGSDVNGTTQGQPNGGGPDGTNDGDGDGIDIDGQATIENFGSIEGTGAGGTGSDGLPNTSEGIAAGGGTITNHTGANISGIGLGILIDDSAQGDAPFRTIVANSGTISGGTSYGIRIVSALNDVIDNDGIISGGGGTAILFGSGANTLRLRDNSAITGVSDGGAGTADILDYQFFTTGVTVDLAGGTATGTGGVTNFEYVNGSAQGDVLTGNSEANILSGNGGADTMSGGAGNDVYYVDSRFDVTIEATNTGGGIDRVSSFVSHTLANNVENLNLVGFANIDGNGNRWANVLNGNSANNVLQGFVGSDTLNGFGGADILNGGTGTDFINPGADARQDIIRFLAVADSTGSQRDIVTGMDLDGEDVFDFTVVPGIVDATITTGSLSLATINADIAAAVNAGLSVNGAILFDPDAGDLNVDGHIFLIVDANGDGIYRPNQDYVVQMINPTGTLTIDDFM